MRRFHIFVYTLAIAGALAFPLQATHRVGAYADRAQELIKQARAALGGEKLEALKSLSASGNYRQQMGAMQMSGDIEFDMLMPDKVLTSRVMKPMPGVEITMFEVMNGNQTWADSKQDNSGGMVMVRRGDQNSPQQLEAQQQYMRSEISRLLLGWLLSTPSSFPVEFTYAGEAESPDGRADAIDVKGPNGFATRLFLDQKTHRPLLLSYQGRPIRVITNTGNHSQEEIEKRIKEHEAEVAALPDVEYQIFLSDYREVGGIQFPHHLTKMSDGKVTEEWEMKQFKINPTIKPEVFNKK